MNEKEYRIMLVTAPDLEIARKLVEGAVGNRFAACGKILPGVESHYWWENKLERSVEYQLILKTHTNKVSLLESWIIDHHPYEVPECVTLSIETGHLPYLKWIQTETRCEATSD